MKSIFRSILVNAAALFLTSRAVAGINFGNDWPTLFWAALALTLINLLVKPIIRILTLPINLLTLGVFSWVIDVALIYLVTIIIPGFRVTAFYFPGFVSGGFSLPALQVSTLFSYLVCTVMISFLANFFSWLMS